MRTFQLKSFGKSTVILHRLVSLFQTIDTLCCLCGEVPSEDDSTLEDKHPKDSSSSSEGSEIEDNSVLARRHSSRTPHSSKSKGSARIVSSASRNSVEGTPYSFQSHQDHLTPAKNLYRQFPQDSMARSKSKRVADLAAAAQANTEAQLAEKDATIEALKAKLAKKESNGSKKKGKKGKTSDDDGGEAEVAAALLTFFKEDEWRITKFLTSDKQIRMSAHRFLDSTLSADFCTLKDGTVGKVGKNLDLLSEESAKNRDDWSDTYGDFVLQALTKQRQYVQNQVKSAANEWMDQHNGDLPIPGQIRLCTSRELPLTQPTTMDKNLELAAWYYDKLLPNVCGERKIWPEDVRHFEHISDATLPESEGKKLRITPSTEAFAHIVYENNYSKWKKMWVVKKENPGKKMMIIKHAKADDDKDPKVHYCLLSDGFEAKYSLPDCGQAKFGGWKKEGLEKFAKTMAKCKEVRTNNRKKCEEWEDAVLAKVKEDNGIAFDSLEEKQRAKKRKTEPVVASVDEVADIMDSDEE